MTTDFYERVRRGCAKRETALAPVEVANDLRKYIQLYWYRIRGRSGFGGRNAGWHIALRIQNPIWQYFSSTSAVLQQYFSSIPVITTVLLRPLARRARVYFSSNFSSWIELR
jgi:hypothetical protein